MRRVHLGRLTVVLAALSFWMAVLLCVSTAHSENSVVIFPNGRQETTIWGRGKRMWNASAAEIAEGTVVMIDTVAAGSGPQIPYGKGFVTWDGVAANVYRICGVTVGTTPSFEAGTVLVEGYHNNVLMAATGYTGGTRLRPSLTLATGALASYTASTDSLSSYCPVLGVFHRYVNTTTLRGQCYINIGSTPFEHR